MVPIPVIWTVYTAVASGRTPKVVPCENCSTEYVYVLEREAEGAGTSLYLLNEEGAERHAAGAAADTLGQYLENDFDAVPCPTCGHYQRYMFPKLYEPTSLWLTPVRLAVVLAGALAAVGAAYWSINYLQQPRDHALGRMVMLWALLAVLGLIGFGLRTVERTRADRFDPNTPEGQQTRIETGRRRAVTRAELEATRRREREAGGSEGGTDADSDPL